MKEYILIIILLTFSFSIRAEEKISDYISLVYTKNLADCSGKNKGVLEYLKKNPKFDDLDKQKAYFANEMATQYISARFLMFELEQVDSKKTIDSIVEQSKLDTFESLTKSDDIKIIDDLLIHCEAIDAMRLDILKNTKFQPDLMEFIKNTLPKNK